MGVKKNAEDARRLSPNQSRYTGRRRRLKKCKKCRSVCSDCGPVPAADQCGTHPLSLPLEHTRVLHTCLCPLTNNRQQCSCSRMPCVKLLLHTPISLGLSSDRKATHVSCVTPVTITDGAESVFFAFPHIQAFLKQSLYIHPRGCCKIVKH